MKTTFRFIIAAMAAIAVFSSCQKEPANETVNNTTGGARTIAVQFDNSTKATLDGFTPKFANGDAIRVSNTEKSEECTVSVDGSGNATFTTTLSGALTAIYPSAAAVLSSGEADAPIATSNNIKVPASQDGSIAKAIIAKAEIAVGSTSATFTSQTALFQITPPAGATTFTITSLKPVVDGVARTGTATAINTDGATDADKLVITVSNNDLSTFYVALKAGVNLSDLSFDAGGTYGMKGIPTSGISTNATVANTKYTIGNTNWHPYVTIGGKKWATMNIGATSAPDAGKYFAWGDIVGQTPSSSTFSPGFSWTTCPFAATADPKFNKYVPASATSYLEEGFGGDTKTVLDLADDAANANWGGSWRMPTKAEFDALGAGEWVSSPGNGIKFGTSSNTIFLPAAGYGYGTGLINVGNYGIYWSSSLNISYPLNAYYLLFDVGNAYTTYFSRYYGRSVRALSE